MQNLVKRLTACVRVGPARRRSRAVVALGLMVASLGVLVAPSAHAQSAGDFQTITTINGPPRAQQDPQRRGGDPRPDELGREANPAPFTTEVVRTVPTRGGATDDTDSTPDAGAGRFDPTADPDAETNARQARQPLDGDFSSPVADDVPVDGDFTLLRPTQPIDGADPASNDTRDADERALFEAPGLQRDPTLFSIDVSPVLTETPRALFRFEPYTPLGVRVGSMIVLPSIETSLRTDSNVFQSEPAERDVAIEIVPTVVAVSNWNVHAIELRASGVFSKFREFDSEDAREYALEARGRLDLRRRTNIEGLILRSVTQESRSALDADPVTAGRADVTTTTGALT
ncbi:MAG: outer membrane beta-barrel protein, partial [Pseudomonadota bacterium]